MTLDIAYTHEYLKYKLGAGDGTHMTQPIRAKLATELLTQRLGEDANIITPAPTKEDRTRLESIHDPQHVSRVLDQGRAHDWAGVNHDNADAALHMFAGTVRLTERIIAGETRVGFNPQGAKHHARYDASEGFCVFNDMAWAAREFQNAGMKPLYIDWDVHAGDGVQNMLADTTIPTLSIHASGIYPFGQGNHSMNPDTIGTSHTWHNEEEHWYNWNLPEGAGDTTLGWALEEANDIVEMYQPDIILLAAGADGHEGEYWGMKYTLNGFCHAARQIAKMTSKHTEGRILIGGAGGYQAETWTPRIWADVVETIYATNYGSLTE